MHKIFFLLLFSPLFAELIDLDLRPQSFVLETKRIIIPEFPHAFNPSIIRYQGKLLLSFRVIPDLKDRFKSDLYLSFLDEQFNPTSSPQLLTLRAPYSIVPSRAEDARLIQVGKKLFIVYSDNEDLMITGGGFRMYISELHFQNQRFTLREPQRLSDWDGQTPIRREKNWTPFDYRGNLFLEYSLDPHLILYPIAKTENCETIALTETKTDWDWGTFRGGTPALKIGNEYLSFFHSQIKMASIHSEGKEMLHYFMGAYTFSSEPPFKITKISPEPIWGKNFYHGENYDRYWGSVRVVFPCGVLLDSQFIWITYGRQDHELWVVKLDKKGLLDSLKDVP